MNTAQPPNKKQVNKNSRVILQEIQKSGSRYAEVWM